MKNCFLVLIPFLLSTILLVDGMVLDNFHCKVATCREFYYGLKHFARHQEYIDTCYDTVYALQNIPGKYGKCFDDTTMKINPACIHALAATMKSCASRLDDLSDNDARFYCVYTVMKHCAVSIGLERLRLNFQSPRPTDD